MSDPIGYNGSVIDYSGFAPCGLCGGVNCEHRIGTATDKVRVFDNPENAARAMRFERRPEVSDEPHDLRPAKPRFGDPPSARATATIRRPDGTIITCPVNQVGEVLEQIRKAETKVDVAWDVPEFLRPTWPIQVSPQINGIGGP